MSLSVRIFIIYMLFISLCAYFILNTVMGEIKPGVRQSTEETLVDTANLLAEFLREPILKDDLQSTKLEQILASYGHRQLDAEIWGVRKRKVDSRIYVTNKHGIVLLDSHHYAVGQDYSQWNDVYLTLRGQYGARSTKMDPQDDRSTVMHVGAPIKHEGEIIGVVTVAKPNYSLQPFIDRARKRLSLLGFALVFIGLLTGALFSWWLSREIGQLRQYAKNVSEGKRARLSSNTFRSSELKQLGQALESMRSELDGKAYVERYIQIFAHELKSPLAGIRAAAELLQSPMPEEQRQRFIENIDQDSQRLHLMLERLLGLAHVEQLQELQDVKRVSLNDLMHELISRLQPQIKKKQIELQFLDDENIVVEGDVFLLSQAILNVLDNALDFSKQAGIITISLKSDGECKRLNIHNTGEPIPDYALPRLTERFYSLPRPDGGRKSSGLGLSFVEEVMQLHGGRLLMTNHNQGVLAVLQFPS